MDIEIVVENQKRINALMSKYEEATRKMIDCPIDDILPLTEKRQSISKEVSKLDIQIKDECCNTPEALSAYKNKCVRDELADSFKQIFDLRQNFNAIAFAITSLEPEIRGRIMILRDELIDKIKENNSGQVAKAAKYVNAGLSGGENLFIPENKKMI